MTTPTPYSPAQIVMRRDLGELMTGLEGQQGRAVRLAIRREVFALFDAATARPTPKAPPSDTNGSEPADVERALFIEPTQAELLAMPREVPNGIEVNG
jgi:hypothetical protein